MSGYISLIPTILETTINGGGIITVRGETDIISPAKNGLSQDWFVSNPDYTISGDSVIGVQGNTEFKTNFTIPKHVPFKIRGVCNRPTGLNYAAFHIALVDNQGRASDFQYGSISTGQPVYVMNYNGQTVIPPTLTPIYSTFEIESDGTYLIYRRNNLEQMRRIIPADVTDYYLRYFCSPQATLQMANIQVAENVPLINAETCVYAFTGGTVEILNTSQLLIKPTTNGSFSLIATHQETGLVGQSQIIVEPLRLRFSRDYVQLGEVITLSTNGLNGILEASSGTVIQGLQWQATELGTAVLTYRMGEFTATKRVTVISRIDIPDDIILTVGDEYQIVLPDDIPALRFECLNFPTFMSSEGLVTIPDSDEFVAPENDFGACILQCKASGYGLQVFFEIEVEPLFPTYIRAKHWLQEDANFLTEENRTLGGYREARRGNKTGVYTWKITYENLTNGDCGHREHDATILSKFWLLCGDTKRFTLIDQITKQKYSRVVIVSTSKDFENIISNQSREMELYWDNSITEL